MQHALSPTSLMTACVSPLGGFCLRFVRTLILSHILMPDDVGAVVVIMSVLTGCELITDVGLDRFVMITVGSARVQAVAVARQIAVVRAIVLAVILAVFAPELSNLFGARFLSGSVVWLGLVPLIGSLKNWRLDQIQQEYRYRPEAITTILSQLAGVVAVPLGFVLFHDHRVIVISLVSETTIYVVLSHLLLPHEPLPPIDPSIRAAALRYCLPLMVNGACLMLIKQLDQIIVANLFGLASLAVYTLGLNLAVTPTSPLQSIAQKVGLPLLGHASANADTFCRATALAVLGMTVLAAAYTLPVGLALEYLVPAVYGYHYQISSSFAALAMVCAFLRFCRGGPTMVLLQQGATTSLMLGNLAAGVGALAGFLAGRTLGRMEGVMAGFALGDFASFIAYLYLVRHFIPLRSTLTHVALLTGTVIAVALVLLIAAPINPALRLLILSMGLGVVGISAAAIWREHGGRALSQSEHLLPELHPSVSKVTR